MMSMDLLHPVRGGGAAGTWLRVLLRALRQGAFVARARGPGRSSRCAVSALRRMRCT